VEAFLNAPEVVVSIRGEQCGRDMVAIMHRCRAKAQAEFWNPAGAGVGTSQTDPGLASSVRWDPSRRPGRDRSSCWTHQAVVVLPQVEWGFYNPGQVEPTAVSRCCPSAAGPCPAAPP
jgi:hypothetical protein